MSNNGNSLASPFQVVLILCACVLAVVGIGWVVFDPGRGAVPAGVDRVPVVEDGDPAVAATDAGGPAAPDGDDGATDAAPPAADPTMSAADPEPGPEASAPEAPGAEQPAADAPADEPAAGAPTDDAGAAPAETASETVAEEAREPDREAAKAALVESILRKARIAADAEILSEAGTKSAVDFYAEAIALDSDNAVARAELADVLRILEIQTTELLENEEFEAAFGIAGRVAGVAPNHRLVADVQETLNRVSGERVSTALQFAEQGDGDAAEGAVAAAESLPGQNPLYFDAVRESIADLLTAREEAAARESAARESAAREVADWMARAREAIEVGRLIPPEPNNALAIIDERAGGDEIHAQLQSEWLTSTVARAVQAVEDQEFALAETLVEAAETYGEESPDVGEAREALEFALATAESARAIPVSEMVALTMEPAVYPRRAEDRGTSGWVDVEFTVSVTGLPTEVAVTGSEPGTTFVDAAVEAVAGWRFEPRLFRGRPMPQRVRARLVFRLD